jgi:hypothetical protein
MRFYNLLLKYPKFFSQKDTISRKHNIIRITIFASIYYDNDTFFLIANSQNTESDKYAKVLTVFNLLMHFTDEFPEIPAPAFNVFEKLIKRNGDTAAILIYTYLNKYIHASNYSRNRRFLAKYFKHLFDIALKNDLLTQEKINEYLLATVVNEKEYMFDALNADNHVYNAPNDPKGELDFLIKLLKLKGKSPYDYMTYCNEHYQSLCLDAMSQ